MMPFRGDPIRVKIRDERRIRGSTLIQGRHLIYINIQCCCFRMSFWVDKNDKIKNISRRFASHSFLNL